MTENALPFISVVLPSRDRARLLADCLENGLFRQTYPAGRWEIILINDGSTDHTAEVIDRLAPRAPVPLRVFNRGGEGAAAGRNFGSRQAQGEIIAHIDDDGRAVPGWLMAAAQAFAPDVGIVTGPILPDPNQQISFFSFVSRSEHDQGLYPTSNIFYRAEAFHEAGGFSEGFGVNLLGRPQYGWDTDLAWKLRRRGLRAVFAPQAITYSHVFALTPAQWLKEPWKTHVLPGVIRHVPEARHGILSAYPFIDPFHRLWCLGFAGLLLALWTPWALLLLLPWLARVTKDLEYDARRPWRWPSALAKGTLLWLRQFITLVSLLYGSLLARRLAI